MATMVLREVEPRDVPELYRHQADVTASRLAAVVWRDRGAHAAHLAKILADPEVVIRTVDVDRVVAGLVLSFPRQGVREVGYWLGREFWGRGLASQALAEFLTVDANRPLYGVVAEHNHASRRVLERNGFVLAGREEPDPRLPPDIAAPLLVLRLDTTHRPTPPSGGGQLRLAEPQVEHAGRRAAADDHHHPPLPAAVDGAPPDDDPGPPTGRGGWIRDPAVARREPGAVSVRRGGIAGGAPTGRGSLALPSRTEGVRAAPRLLPPPPAAAHVSMMTRIEQMF